MIRACRRLIERAWGYYRLYGARRFFWAVMAKTRQRLSPASVRHDAVPPPPPPPPPSDDAQSPAPTQWKRRSTDPYQAFFDHWRVDTAIARAPNKVMRKPNVAIIGDLNLPQCKKYRVMQKLEAFASQGIGFHYSHYDDVPRAMNIMQMATFVIFYRTHASPTFDLLLNECHRLGIPNAYDIDDPIFSEKIYSSNINLQHLDMIERNNLLASAHSHYLAMRQCDTGIVSTPRLVSELRARGMNSVYLWRNAIDAETANAIALAENDRKGTRPRTKRIRIVYASGSRAHEADFREISGVLTDVLKAHPGVTLHIIGYLELPKEFEPFENRIIVEPFTDYATYIRRLAACDISLVPLVRDDFNDCKSAIRYMEAAQVQTPSVVSAIGDFVNIIEDGVDGFLAERPQDWAKAINKLIASSKLRRSIGAAAREKTTRTLTVTGVFETLDDELKAYIHGRY